MDDATQFRQQFEALLQQAQVGIKDVYEYEDMGQRVYSVQLVFPDGSRLPGQAITEILDTLPEV